MYPFAHSELLNLPVWELRESIASSLKASGRLVLTAPTGSGKSTAVPYILDGFRGDGEVWILEPRRLAARMLARRVATLCGCSVGGHVGFQTRYEACVGRETRIRFMTAGILPRVLLRNPQLDGVSAVVFDEFHERSIDVDLGLGLVRELVETTRPDLRVLVMSATLDAEAVAKYLDAPVLQASGRLFPVEVEYRPPRSDERVWDAAAKAVVELLRDEDEGDVLVFMPGSFEIGRTVRELEPLRRRFGVNIYPLHGSMVAGAQNRVMETGDKRRVIVATNIAETSLTIPGVRHVVDSGLVRIARYDAGRGVDMVIREPISIQAADQRAGRAGRTASGRCLRLWNLQTQYAKPPRTEAEIQRSDLAPVMLQLHGLGYPDSAGFPWLDSPDSTGYEQAESVLRDLQAVDLDGALTDLGRKLLEIPAHPRVGRFLVEADRRACGWPAALAAAVLTERPFMPRERKHWQILADRFGREHGPASDLLVAVGVLDALSSDHQGGNVGTRTRVTAEDVAILGVHAGAAREALRAAKHLAAALEKAHGTHRRSIVQSRTLDEVGDDLICCMAVAFPDHLARRRDQSTLLCELRNGRSAELARHSTARGGQFLVAGEVRGTEQRGISGKTILDMASELPVEWLRELFGAEFVETVETVWDNRRCEARTEMRVCCLGLVLEQEVVAGGDPEREAVLLAEHVWRNRESLRHWDEELQRWLDRVRWLVGVCPERGLLSYDDDDLRLLIEEFCAGQRRFAAVRNKPLLPYVHNALSWEDQEFVRTMAPERIRLPSGRRMRIDYDPARRPRGKARIQDLYGLTETPAIADGREKLLIEIQAPNFRAVQITDDLATFWRDLYPKVKSELSRRYPKHEWR